MLYVYETRWFHSPGIVMSGESLEKLSEMFLTERKNCCTQSESWWGGRRPGGPRGCLLIISPPEFKKKDTKKKRIRGIWIHCYFQQKILLLLILFLKIWTGLSIRIFIREIYNVKHFITKNETWVFKIYFFSFSLSFK